MVAVMVTTQAPVEMQIALLVFAVVGIGLALHENGWLRYLRSRLVIALLVALLLASSTVQAAYYYDTAIYCAWAFWDWFC
jgi:type IV secretory pathway VirB2 component (pilin)